MRIALLTDGIYPYVMGGMQKHSFYLAKYFAINKVNVDLYHTGENVQELTELSCFTEDEKKYIHPIVIPFPKLDSFPGHYIRESGEYSKRIFQAYHQRNEKIDFIYAQGFSGWEIIKKKASSMPFPPIGVHFHGLEMFQPPPDFRSRIEQIMLRKPVLFNLKNADYVFSLGGKLTAILKETGIEALNIIEIPLGIDKSWMNESIPQNEFGKRKFVFIGRFERRKGVPELNQALKAIMDKYDFEFDFIGPIPEKVQLKSTKIKYHGSISDVEKIKTVLRNSDVLVCPSHSEGMPNVIVEAMASGVALIATDVGAVSVLVSEKTGCLIETPDPSKIELAMIKFIEMDNSELEQKKINAMNLIKEKFTWEKISIHTINVLSELIK